LISVVLADLANPDHQAAILDLLDMYSRDHFGAGHPLPEQTRTDLIPGLVNHGGARVFLAYDGKKYVGLAICLIGFSTFQARPLLNIHDIAVTPEARGQGIGRKIFQAIAEDARELGCCKLTLEVRSDNHRAQALYKAVGFEASQPGTWFWTRPLPQEPLS
jgi:ribosomal protein S18 acetylase RimI-like enzyme